MKLKNPDLYTSFYVNRRDEIFHIFHLYVVCHFNDLTDTFTYHLYGHTYESYDVHLELCFDSPKEAFTAADRICSAYPRIGSDLDSYHLDEYPEFHKEVFEDEH